MRPLYEFLGLTVGVVVGVLWLVWPFLLNSLLYFPSRHLSVKPADIGLDARDVTFETEDGETRDAA